jgi:hypothetical protein
MTNREAIEYIERECKTCKGFYAPENECIAVPQDCFESKRLAISALEREERRKGCDGGYHRKNTTFKETLKKALVENLLDFDEFSEEEINDMAEHINNAIETER